MKKTRRKFLQTSVLALPTVSFGPIPDLKGEVKPLVLSTWDSGVIANNGAWPILMNGGSALDAVEQAGIAIEDHLSCCVGLGGNPDRDGHVTLDACIMDDEANCGSVAFLERIKHPVSVARKVMEETPHVMLVGSGAQQFALQQGFSLEEDKLSEDASKAYKKWLEEAKYQPVKNIERTQFNKGKGPFAPSMLPDGTYNHDTMGTIAIDLKGNLSGMCTTSGMGFKMRGRVGDSPIIGSGLFVDNEIGAAVATGQGEEIIRISGCHLVVELMRQGASAQEACEKAIARIAKRDLARARDFQACFIAIDRMGETGAFALHQGFNYSLLTKTIQNKVVNSESYF